MKKKGVSDVVVTILIVLLALAAIAVLWVFIVRALNDSTEKAEQEEIFSSIQFSCTSVVYDNSNNIRFAIQRRDAGEPLRGVKLLVISKNGSSAEIRDYQSDRDIKQFTTLSGIIYENQHGFSELRALAIYPVIESEGGKVVVSSRPVANCNFEESFCRDGRCNGGETCLTCEEDCGPCGRSTNQGLPGGIGDGSNQQPPGSCNPPCTDCKTCNNGVCINAAMNTPCPGGRCGAYGNCIITGGGGAGSGNQNCVPTHTCSSLGRQCGSINDGCDNILNCGNCERGYVCSPSGQCVDSMDFRQITRCDQPGETQINEQNKIYYIQNDLNSSGRTCLTIGASNVTIEGQNRVIRNVGSASGTYDGIYSSGKRNVAIRNLLITGFNSEDSTGIRFINTNASLIEEVNATLSKVGVLIDRSSSIVIRNSRFRINVLSGLEISNSKSIQVANNLIQFNGIGSSSGGVSFQNSSEIIFRNNSVCGNGNYDIYCTNWYSGSSGLENIYGIVNGCGSPPWFGVSLGMCGTAFNPISLNSCRELNESNKRYVLVSNVSSSGTCFNITAENVTLDCQNWSNRIIYGDVANETETPYYGIYSNQRKTTIRNCDIRLGGYPNVYNLGRYGIYFEGSTYSSLENINVRNNRYGIYLEESSNNYLSNITSGENRIDGIYLKSSSYNNLNKITSNNNYYRGMSLEHSSNNYLSEIASEYNVYGSGISIESSSNNSFINVKANNNPTGIDIDYSANNSLTNIISNNNEEEGISIFSSEGNNINNITSKNNFHSGISLRSSSNNNLSIITTSSSSVGVYIFGSSNNSLNIISSSNNSYGVYILSSSNNNLSGIISNNNSHGVYLSSSSNNILRNASSQGNLYRGIVIEAGSRNNLSIITLNNNPYGLVISSSSNNIFSNLTLNNSTQGIILSSSSNNSFTSGRITPILQSLYAIRLTGTISEGNIFNNLITADPNYDFFSTSSSINGTQFVDMPLIGNYSFGSAGGTIIVRRTGIGEVRFLQSVNGSGTNLTRDVFIGYNFVDVRSDSNSGLNRSANITFFNMPGNFVNPVILRNGVPCSSDFCYNFTSLNAQTVVFNVSGAGNYSIGNF